MIFGQFGSRAYTVKSYALARHDQITPDQAIDRLAGRKDGYYRPFQCYPSAQHNKKQRSGGRKSGQFRFYRIKLHISGNRRHSRSKIFLLLTARLNKIRDVIRCWRRRVQLFLIGKLEPDFLTIGAFHALAVRRQHLGR